MSAPSGFQWTWTDAAGTSHTCVLDYNAGGAPSRSESLQPTSSEIATTARSYPIYRFGGGMVRTIKASGVIYADDTLNPTHGKYADFVALASARHATYTDADGLTADVAITSVSIERRGPGYLSVTVESKVESR